MTQLLPCRFLSNAEERRLVAAMRRGDLQARDTLLASVGPLILRFASRFAGGPDDMDDLVQWMQLRMLSVLDRFDPRQSRLTTFSYRALLWEALRRRKERRQCEQTIDGDLDLLIESRERPVDATADERINAEVLHQLIDCLPMRMGEIVRGRMAGRTLTDLGKQFGVTKERVRQIESKAHDFLRRAIGDLG